tara:strand:+ start:802 stop:1113 length:312 start_codon:yes stop_codon:yes gene_type:complete
MLYLRLSKTKTVWPLRPNCGYSIKTSEYYGHTCAHIQTDTLVPIVPKILGHKMGTNMLRETRNFWIEKTGFRRKRPNGGPSEGKENGAAGGDRTSEAKANYRY